MYINIWNNIIDKINQLIRVLIEFFKTLIITFIDLFYPVFDLEKKFDQITLLDDDYEIFENDDIGLGQSEWNKYVLKLSKIKNNNKMERDMFDILIIQKIHEINFVITLAINRSKTKRISYGVFKKKLSKILGNAVEIKYRLTTNPLFESIFKDNGPYRRFKYCDLM